MVVLQETANNFEPIKEGLHKGRCFASIDLGTQKEEYKGETKLRRKVRLVWESYDDTREDGAPMIIGSKFTNALTDNAALVKLIKPWVKNDLKPGFDTDDLVGKPCVFLIEHKPSADGSRIYANITKCMPLNESEAQAQHNNPVRFSLDAFDQKTFNDFPEWLQDIIKLSPEYAEAAGVAPADEMPPHMQAYAPIDGLDDEISF